MRHTIREWNKEEIGALLSLEEEDLFEMLGRHVDAEKRHMVPLSRKKAIEYGHWWFESRIDRMRDLVCGSTKIQQLANFKEGQVLLLAIADLVAGVCTGVSPATVATLLLRKGIKELCESRWRKEV